MSVKFSQNTITEQELVRDEKRAIIRNLVLIWIIWVCVFSVYSSLEALQTTLNPGYGAYSITIAHGGKAISSLLGPFAVMYLTPKWTLVTGFLCHTTYVLANFYATPLTLLSAGVLVGIATGPIQVCFGIYVTVLGVRYSELTATSKTAVLSKFNGLVATCIPTGFILGSLISSSVFKFVQFSNNEYTTTMNMTEITEEHLTTLDFSPSNLSVETLQHPTLQCGPDFCPSHVPTSSNSTDASKFQPDPRNLYLLVGIYAILNLSGVLITFLFLENISRQDLQSGMRIDTTRTVCQHLAHYLRAFFQPDFLLLTPCITNLFAVTAFFGATFTRAYITCELGVAMIGYILVLRGVTGILSSAGTGLLGQKIHRNLIFLFGWLVIAVTLIILLLWGLWEHVTLVLLLSMLLAGLGNAATHNQATGINAS